MGWDVTFHPVGADELERFVFQPAGAPTLGPQRAAELTNDPGLRDMLAGNYARIPDWLASGEPCEKTFSFLAACVAGFRHPYHYARGAAICFALAEDEGFARRFPRGLFQPLSSMAPVMAEVGGEVVFSENYSASGWIPPRRLARLRRAVEESSYFASGSEGRRALLAAIDYARERGLGLLEATDLVVPIAGSCSSDPNNLRADFLAGAPVAPADPMAELRERVEALRAQLDGPPPPPVDGAPPSHPYSEALEALLAERTELHPPLRTNLHEALAALARGRPHAEWIHAPAEQAEPFLAALRDLAARVAELSFKGRRLRAKGSKATLVFEPAEGRWRVGSSKQGDVRRKAADERCPYCGAPCQLPAEPPRWFPCPSCAVAFELDQPAAREPDVECPCGETLRAGQVLCFACLRDPASGKTLKALPRGASGGQRAGANRVGELVGVSLAKVSKGPTRLRAGKLIELLLAKSQRDAARSLSYYQRVANRLPHELAEEVAARFQACGFGTSLEASYGSEPPDEATLALLRRLGLDPPPSD